MAWLDAPGTGATEERAMQLMSEAMRNSECKVVTGAFKRTFSFGRVFFCFFVLDNLRYFLLYNIAMFCNVLYLFLICLLVFFFFFWGGGGPVKIIFLMFVFFWGDRELFLVFFFFGGGSLFVVLGFLLLCLWDVLVVSLVC